MKKEIFVQEIQKQLSRFSSLTVNTQSAEFVLALEELHAKVTPRKIVVVGPFCWGKGDSMNEAIKNCRANWSSCYGGNFSQTKLTILVCSEDATVDDMGGVTAKTIVTVQDATYKKKK
jgi:hypothetical protein